MNKLCLNGISLWIVVSLTLSACTPPAPPATPTTSSDKLSEILARGRLIVATDLAYPPQSELKPGATRAANTQCTATEYTADELTGFDVDTAVEIARRLGVEACFVAPAWTHIVGGGWGDRWDISVGSVTITAERMQVLYFTQPYYATPATIFVHKDNTTFSQLSDLSGKRIGVCAGCTFERYLEGTLSLPGQKIDFAINDAQIVAYDAEPAAMEDLALGDGMRLDAIMTQLPVGLNAIKNNQPFKQLNGPVYFAYAAVAVDKKHARSSVSLVQKANEIIQHMHRDGTLLKLSQQYHELDLATEASKFDIQALKQFP